MKSVKAKDEEHGFGAQQDDQPVHVPAWVVKQLGAPGIVADGEW